MDVSGAKTAQDAEAEERATDEGMPEQPGTETSVAARTDPTPAREPIGPPDAGPDRPVEVDDLEEDDGGYDLGGEG